MSRARPRARLLVSALGEATRWLDGSSPLAHAVADLETVYGSAFGVHALHTAWRRVVAELAALEDDARGGPFLILVHEDMRDLGPRGGAAPASAQDLDLCLALALHEMRALIPVSDGWSSFVEASDRFVERAGDLRPDALELWWLCDTLHDYLTAVLDRRDGPVAELLCTWLRERPPVL